MTFEASLPSRTIWCRPGVRASFQRHAKAGAKAGIAGRYISIRLLRAVAHNASFQSFIFRCMPSLKLRNTARTTRRFGTESVPRARAFPGGEGLRRCPSFETQKTSVARVLSQTPVLQRCSTLCSFVWSARQPPPLPRRRSTLPQLRSRPWIMSGPWWRSAAPVRGTGRSCLPRRAPTRL